MRTVLALTILLFIASCSSNDGKFRLKGKFKNFNQGELYVYNLMGKGNVDTVRLSNGKFNYEVQLDDTAFLSIVFPNFSEIPIVGSPGANIMMEGDASHLREVMVTGDDENKQLTQFRLHINELTPPEQLREATQYINEHPASPSSLYVLNRFILLKPDADFSKAYNLITKMAKASPGNKRLAELRNKLSALRSAKKGDKLPIFSAATTTGRRVSNADLKGELNVVSLWATWNYESQSAQRQLRRLQKQYGSRLQLLSISIDGNPEECKKTASRDSLLWPLVCDGKMWAMPVISQFGLYNIPDHILIDRNGSIILRSTTINNVSKEIEQRLSN